MNTKEFRQNSEAGCSDMKNTLPAIEEQKKAVTVEEIKEYIDDYPYELLTPDEEDRVRDEIVYEKNGGTILDGILTELDEKLREIEIKKEEKQ